MATAAETFLSPDSGPATEGDARKALPPPQKLEKSARRCM